MKQLASRKFGHNLISLFAEANRHGLSAKIEIEPMEAGVLDLLSYDYASKRFEYRLTDGTYYLPRIEVTEAIARKLVGRLDDFCSGASRAQDA